MTAPARTGLRVEPFTSARVPALRAFNQRLAAGGSAWRFPDDPEPDWLRRVPGSEVFQELFVLLEGEAVRGGYVLKRQRVALRGEVWRVGNLYMPLSEGTVNQTYSLVGARLFSDAGRRESLLFALGLGGDDARVTGLVRALGWELHPVPFYFKVLDGSRFLKQIRYLRTAPQRALLLDLAAASGAAWLAALLARTLMTRRPRIKPPLGVDVVHEFGDWADQLWQAAAASYSFVAVRTSSVLNRVYPPGRAALYRLRVTSAGKVIGYAVVQDEQRHGSELLGSMRVGTLVDAFALPAHAEAVAFAAARHLEKLGVDLIISNQSHPAWGAALRRAGFMVGPTNCTFAVAKPLAERIRRVDPYAQEMHLNRGDGDWPWGVNLRVTAAGQS
jgi:hypothetical protein